VAIERNPCEEQQPVQPGGSGPAPKKGKGPPPKRGGGNGGQPTEVAASPERVSAPFPQPFLPQDSDEASQIYEPHTLTEKFPYPRVFATATREITIIPNSLCLTKDAPPLAELKKTVSRNSSRTKRLLNHGNIYFKGRPKEDLEEADLFRWSLENYWYAATQPSKHESIRYKPTAGHENPYATQDQPRNSTIHPGIRSIKLLPLDQSGNYSLARVSLSRGGIRIENSGNIQFENVRFALYNDVSKNWVGIRNNREQFLETYAPRAFITSGKPVQEKMNMLINMYLYGNDRRQNWGAVGQLEDWPGGSTADFYRRGILKTDPRGDDNWRYKDYVFDAPVAFFEEELNGMLMAPFHSAKITKNVGNVDFVNIKGYESELEVPNIYYYYNSLELQKDYKEGILDPESNALQQSAANLGMNQILSAYRSLKKARIDPDSAEYDPDVVLPGLNMLYKTSNILKFPSNRVEKFNEINEFMKAYAENYVEIKINTTQGGQIGALLQKNNLDRILMETMYPEDSPMAEIDGASTFFTTKASMILDDSFKTSEPEQNSIVTTLYGEGTQSGQSTLNDRVVNNLPITIRDGFYDILKTHLPNSSNYMFQKVNMKHYPLFYTGWNNVPMLRLEETIKSQIFCTEFEEFISNAKLQRSYVDLLSGEKAYSEVVGYVVEKHEILESGEEVFVQKFVLMDSNEIDTINFLDSQVMPFKEYRYKIFSINFVLGTEYRYDVNNTSVSSPYIDLGIMSKLGVYLIEAPFFEQVVEIRDMPPISPQVSFLPIQGVEDKVKILMTMNYGEETEPYLGRPKGQRLSSSFKQKLKTKYGMDKNGLIKFKTDSLPAAYEVCRINVPPEHINFFYSNGDIFRKEDPERIWRSHRPKNKAALIEHDMEPNKYYYYVFRAIDNYRFGDRQWNKKNALYSNPTEVFRVRMVSYANGIFLEAEPYEMVENKRVDNIVFERLLKVAPNFEQTIVDYSSVFESLKEEIQIPDNSVESARFDQGLMTHEQYIASHYDFQKSAPNPEGLTLGNEDSAADSIWDKKFKIRIRSKDSGKMIDLVVKFIQDTIDLTGEE